MKTHEQAREKAEAILEHRPLTMAAVPYDLKILITTAILDAQKEAVKEAVTMQSVLDAMLDWERKPDNNLGLADCDVENLAQHVATLLTTYEQRNDEGREG